jgi:hypothetical protein
MQAQDDGRAKTSYAVELNQFITGSGFKSGTELSVTLISGQKRTLSLGVFLCSEKASISGITAHHEVSLIRNPYARRIVPYAFYNMVFRVTKTDVSNPEIPDAMELHVYKSFEHHIGFGIDVKLLQNLHLKGGVGYGVYFGSIKKPTTDFYTGTIYGSNGFAALSKIGLAYTF